MNNKKYDTLKAFTYVNDEKQNDLFQKFFKTELDTLQWCAEDGKLYHNIYKNYVYDPDTEYNLNSKNYRSIEFDEKDIDMLIVGCSITFGMGVPEGKYWIPMFQEETKQKIVSISVPGASLYRLCQDVMLYCKNYGKPKKIMALMPDFYRVDFPINNMYHVSKTPNRNKDLGISVLILDPREEINESPIETPFSIEDRVSADFGIYYGLNALMQLELFCEFAGIEIVWSTWNSQTKLIIDEILKMDRKFFKNYDSGFLDAVDEEKILDGKCHRDHKFKNENAWDIGTDTPPGNGRAHPGIHYHVHVYEYFKDLYEKKWGQSNEKGI